MKSLTCQRCRNPFEAETTIGYCEGCQQHYAAQAFRVRKAQRPMPHIMADTSFLKPADCPHTVTESSGGRGRILCGLCGSGSIEAGYGLVPGFGCGTFYYCCNCGTYLDFSPDVNE
jgi:hypothetical protein